MALLPADRFVGVASANPAPQYSIDVPVTRLESPLGYPVAIIVGPAPQQRVALSQQLLLSQTHSGVNQIADLLSQDLHFALCGSDQQFVLIFAHGVPQEVEARLDVGNDGLLL